MYWEKGGDEAKVIIQVDAVLGDKGLKNTAQLFSLFGLANLALVRRRLLALRESNPS